MLPKPSPTNRKKRTVQPGALETAHSGIANWRPAFASPVVNSCHCPFWLGTSNGAGRLAVIEQSDYSASPHSIGCIICLPAHVKATKVARSAYGCLRRHNNRVDVPDRCPNLRRTTSHPKDVRSQARTLSYAVVVSSRGPSPISLCTGFNESITN